MHIMYRLNALIAVRSAAGAIRGRVSDPTWDNRLQLIIPVLQQKEHNLVRFSVHALNVPRSFFAANFVAILIA